MHGRDQLIAKIRKNPALLFSLMVDNNPDGVRSVLIENGYQEAGSMGNAELKALCINEWRRGMDVSPLFKVKYQRALVNRVISAPAGVQPGNATAGVMARGAGQHEESIQQSGAAKFLGIDFGDVDWGSILGGAAAGILGMLGFGGNKPNPDDYTEEILGMQKTVFYAVAGIGTIILILVVYLIVKKK